MKKIKKKSNDSQIQQQIDDIIYIYQTIDFRNLIHVK